MGWNGKIIGAGIGMLVGGPVGAALGLLVGHQFDVGDAHGVEPGLASAARVQALYFPAVFRVMGHVAKADGRVSEQEIAAARSVMGALRLTPDQVRLAIRYFGEGKQPDFGLDAELAELRPLLRAYPQLAQFFIEIQLQASLAGNGLGARPRARLLRTANFLGLTSDDFGRLEALMRWRMAGAAQASAERGPSEADKLRQAYALLETAAGASDQQVVKAYRRQMSRNHPDKLQANGLPESMLERAKERTQQIQAAYELVRAARGMH
ncbi:MAG TPA: co-chaperone DjlA [Steroidobacteraceae bacterium]|jgi:DnaJ like chaperone protein|nr:co-chaperone DjlA [Steroidobacteraceae bacterium]